MEGGLLSLRWNDHSHTFFDMLSTIRRKESYCDVTLVSDGRFYPVHKLVLSTCSDFFDNLFSRTDCKHPVVIVANVSHKDLEALLNYMYLGEVNVLQTELGNLMKAAEVLKIKGLAEPTKSATKDNKDRHHKSSSELFDSSTKRKRIEDSGGPSSKRSQCAGRPDSTESARSRASSDLQTLSKDSDRGAILPTPSSSNADPKEPFTRTVYEQKGSRDDGSSEKAIRPEVKVEEIMVKDEPGSWFNENDDSGANVSYSETDSNIEYNNQTVDYANSCVPWELSTAAQPHPLESHLPQGMPGASGLQAEPFPAMKRAHPKKWRKLSDEERAKLLVLAKANPNASSEKLRSLLAEFNIDISARTIRRELIDAGIKPSKPSNPHYFFQNITYDNQDCNSVGESSYNDNVEWNIPDNSNQNAL